MRHLSVLGLNFSNFKSFNLQTQGLIKVLYMVIHEFLFTSSELTIKFQNGNSPIAGRYVQKRKGGCGEGKIKNCIWSALLSVLLF